jgi:putative membrane protein
MSSLTPLDPARLETPRLPAESARVRWVIGGLTLFVMVAVLLVIVLGPGKHQRGGAPSPLATLNVVLNGSAGVALVAGYLAIRSRRIELHRRCMLTAFGLSSLFLVSYLVHHARVGSVPFDGTGLIRTIYLSILFPHIVLAAVIVPLALFTIYRGWTGRYGEHRRIARWTLPLWLYVSLSGVAIYYLLYW